MAKKKAAKTGVLALARAAATKMLKNDNWRVSLDPDQLKEPLEHLPTGSLVIDYLIGGEPNAFGISPCPGLPRRRITQLWGHESSGKTTLALTAAATTCAAGGTVLYVDWENDIVPDYAAALGVPIANPEKFELVQPESLEEGIKLIRAYVVAGVDLVIIDSVGAAAPQVMVDRKMEETGNVIRVGLVAKTWSEFLPLLKSDINKTGTAVLGISQTRANINTSGYGGGPTTSPQGGNAWKFYSSLRIELRRIKNEKGKRHNALTHKSEDRIYGGVIRAKMVKCKLSKSQGREELFYIRWGEGIDDIRSIMEIAIGHGVVKKGGAWLTWEPPEGETVKVQGTERLRAHLLKNPDQFQGLYGQVRPYLTGTQYDVDGDDSEAVDPMSTAIDDIIEEVDFT